MIQATEVGCGWGRRKRALEVGRQLDAKTSCGASQVLLRATPCSFGITCGNRLEQGAMFALGLLRIGKLFGSTLPEAQVDCFRCLDDEGP